jgi:type I restriction enzyme S subunit
MSDQLPKGWAMAPLGTLGRYINGRAFKPAEWESEGLPIIRIQNLNDPSAPFNYSSRQHDERVKVRNGDLLIAWSASLGAFIWQGGNAWLNQHIFRVEHNEAICTKEFLLHAVRHAISDLYDKAHGTGMVHVTKPVFEAHEVPLAPLPEQRRIVAKLGALLGQVDACQKRLAKIPTILKRFRQAVLAAACSGRLTEDWREESKAAIVGQTSKPNTDLPEIPESWRWVKLPDTGNMSRGKSRHRPRNEPSLFGGSYPFIQTGDIAQSGGRITNHKQTYSEAGLAQSRLWPTGTICITIAANIAESAILTYPACFPDSVVGIIANTEISVAEYVEFFIRVAKTDLATFAPATAQKNINIGILNEVQVPLPPLPEQQEIVRRVESLFASDIVRQLYG